HVEREPNEARGRVARAVGCLAVGDVDLLYARAAREHERLRELLLADRPVERLDRLASVGVEGAAEVRDRHPGEAAQQAVDGAGRQPAQERVASRGATA